MSQTTESHTTEQVAAALIVYLRQARNTDAIAQLYADDVETVEADPARTRRGKAVVLRSMQNFADAHTFAYDHIDGPVVSGRSFALRLAFTATNRSTGQAFAVDELGVYTVRDGRIAREQFYY